MTKNQSKTANEILTERNLARDTYVVLRDYGLFAIQELSWIRRILFTSAPETHFSIDDHGVDLDDTRLDRIGARSPVLLYHLRESPIDLVDTPEYFTERISLGNGGYRMLPKYNKQEE